MALHEGSNRPPEAVTLVGFDSIYRSGLQSVMQNHGIEVRTSEFIIPLKPSQFIILIDPPLEVLTKVKDSSPLSVLFVIFQKNMQVEDLIKAGISIGCSIETTPDVMMSLLSLGMMPFRGAFVYPQLSFDSGNENQLQRQISNVLDEQFRLTKAEIAVMDELVRGSSNKVIARNLRLSEATIKAHMRSIFLKMAVKTRSGAALKWAGQLAR